MHISVLILGICKSRPNGTLAFQKSGLINNSLFRINSLNFEDILVVKLLNI